MNQDELDRLEAWSLLHGRHGVDHRYVMLSMKEYSKVGAALRCLAQASEMIQDWPGEEAELDDLACDLEELRDKLNVCLALLLSMEVDATSRDAPAT